MTKYFSATTTAFYDDEIINVNQMPEDAVVVPEEDYLALMAKQDEGYVIVADLNGNPTFMQQTCNPCTCLSHDIVKATDSALGHVKVDGQTITADEDGTISVLDALPDQTNNSGKFLKTDGESASWETVDALPSQTGNDGKFLTTDGTNASWEGLPLCLPIGTSIYQPVTEMGGGFVRSTGSFIAGSVYPEFYQILLNILNGTDTTKGWSVKSSTEAYTDFDYVVNATDSTFRFSLKNGSEDLKSDIYDMLTLNASGSTYTAPANGWFSITMDVTANNRVAIFKKDDPYTNIFQVPVTNAGRVGGMVFVNRGDEIRIDWAGSSIEFRFVYAKGNGNLFFKAYNEVKDYSGLNVEEALNGKADKDLTNLTQAGTIACAHQAMPSDRYIDLTVGASGSTYTAPADGYFTCTQNNNASGFINLIGDNLFGSMIMLTAGSAGKATLPIKKGGFLTYIYSGRNPSGADNLLRFIYAEGAY